LCVIPMAAALLWSLSDTDCSMIFAIGHKQACYQRKRRTDRRRASTVVQFLAFRWSGSDGSAGTFSHECRNKKGRGKLTPWPLSHLCLPLTLQRAFTSSVP